MRPRDTQDPGRESGPGAVIGWGNMALLAALVSTYAIRVLADPSARPEFMQERFATVPLAASLHILGGTIALTVGPLQLSARLRESSLGRHRWLGRLYALAVLVGGPSGIVLATMAQGGLAARVGFALLGALWIASTTMGVLRIRARQLDSHRAWMMRSYALAFAAVMLRIYMPLGQAAGIPFEVAYPAIAWASWVPNLVLVEWVLLPRVRASGALPPRP